ncbi:MAG: hypothetical protein DRJ30_03370 [Candidatus Methanomethylicota archaeon]|nr:MAG: hypothetical protein DRJ30_03370 [Candidatus Verstraetearchaeota archaeon]
MNGSSGCMLYKIDPNITPITPKIDISDEKAPLIVLLIPISTLSIIATFIAIVENTKNSFAMNANAVMNGFFVFIKTNE